MIEEREIEEKALLKVWVEEDEIPFGFTEGQFTVDIEHRYLEVRMKNGDITGMFFSMFSYVRDADLDEDEDKDVRGYN